MNFIQIIKVSLVTLLSSLFLYCNYGGETVNERTVTVYMPDGVTRAGNAAVTIGSVENDRIYYTGTTDKNGQFEVPSLYGDKFAVFIEKLNFDSNAIVAFQNPVSIFTENHNISDDTLLEAGCIRGVVAFPNYHMTRHYLGSVTLHILGTEKYANVDDRTGEFRFDGLAMGAKYDIQVHPQNLPGYTDLFLNGIMYPAYAQELTLDTIRLELNGIPPVQIKSLVYDSLTGVARIEWNSPSADNPLYYNIYRLSIDRSNDERIPIAVGSTRDTFFLDTLFATAQNRYQHAFYDSSVYRFIYRIEIVNNNREKNVEFYDPKDTVVVSSPWRYHTEIISTLIDSVTGIPVQNVAEGKTAAIVVSLSNKRFPFSSWRYLNENDSILKIVHLKIPVVEFIDTLFFNYSVTSKKAIILEMLDSAGQPRPFGRDTINLEIIKMNLMVSKINVSPDILIAGKRFDVNVVISSEGTGGIGEVPFAIRCFLDDSFIGTKKASIIPGGRTDVSFVQTDFADTILLTPGEHTLSVAISTNDSLSESDLNDNIRTITIFVTDIDLELVNITHDPEHVFDGNEVTFKAAITNKGSTDYRPHEYARVSFSVDGVMKSWGFIDTIKAGDTVVTSGIYNDNGKKWIADAGMHALLVKVDPDSIIMEPDKLNNFQKLTINVDNFNLHVDKFSACLSDSLTDIQYSALIIKDGSFADRNPNREIDSLAIDFTIGGRTDTTVFVPFKELLEHDSLRITIVQNIDLCNDGRNDLNCGIVIDPQHRILEKNTDDNKAAYSIKKMTVDINSEMDKGYNGVISGWMPVIEGPDTSVSILRWDAPGERDSKSQTISINTASSAYAHWMIPISVERGRHYIFSYWVQGSAIQQNSTERPPVSVSIANTGFNVAAPDTGSYDWQFRCGILRIPDFIDKTNIYYLSCNLGYMDIGSEDNKASGTVIFDEVRLETYPTCSDK